MELLMRFIYCMRYLHPWTLARLCRALCFIVSLGIFVGAILGGTLVLAPGNTGVLLGGVGVGDTVGCCDTGAGALVECCVATCCG
eukprot:14126692-Ditylum_brightwellii.AAC.1